MKIILALQDLMYDCDIRITDAAGQHGYRIEAVSEGDASAHYLTVDVEGETFDMTLIPVMPPVASLLQDMEENSWKDKFAKKVTGVLVSVMDKTMLRVGCDYHIQHLQDGDRLDLTLQYYMFGTFDRFSVLELIPIMYMFFEVSHFHTRFIPAAYYETNRKEVLKAAKTWALTDLLGNGFFSAMITYPIQVGRIKWLSRNKHIRKTLTTFHAMSETERQAFLEKQERFMDSV